MTSLSVNYSSSASSASVPIGTVNVLPKNPQEDSYICINPPGGLAAGTYYIKQMALDIDNPLANIEFAWEENTGLYYARRVASLSPTVWGSWMQISGGGAGVTSFNGRTGAVVSVAGDYTATQITNVPSGNIPSASTNVQLALNYLQIYAPPPAAFAGTTGPFVIIANSGWVDVPSAYLPGSSRSTFPGGSFAAGSVSGIQDIQTSATGSNLLLLSATIGITTTITGNFGIRIVRNGTIAVSQNVCPSDGTAAANLTTTAVFGGVVGDTYTIMVNNLTASSVTVGVTNLRVTNFGPTPP